MKGNSVVYSASFGAADKARGLRNTADTRFNIGSMDKQFTAVAIGQLVEQGRLDLDSRLIDVLPDYPNRVAAEAITIRHLLSHRAGLGMLFDRTGWDWKTRYKLMGDLLPLFAAAEPAFAPGSRFSYSNEGFVVLGAVVELPNLDQLAVAQNPFPGRNRWRRLYPFKRRAIKISATDRPAEELAERGMNQTGHGRPLVEAVPDE
jgi:hypothetical protein